MKIARVYISLKASILDPEGQTIHHALQNLGFDQLSSCRVGRYIELTFPDITREEAELRANDMCRRLLVNPVMEDYRIDIVEA